MVRPTQWRRWCSTRTTWPAATEPRPPCARLRATDQACGVKPRPIPNSQHGRKESPPLWLLVDFPEVGAKGGARPPGEAWPPCRPCRRLRRQQAGRRSPLVLALLSCRRRGGCEPGSDAREIMSGVLRRGPPTVCERRAGRSDPPLRRLRRPSGRPRGGSLLPVVSCARVSISHSNRHKWRRDELRTGRRFARGLSQQLREEARQSHPRLISG